MALYNSYFGFFESPFENKLDQRFLFLGQDHQEVLSALLYFIKERKGLGMVCGDVGTGKTMLLNSFLSNLPAAVQPIVIANPLVDYQTLLSYIATALGITRRDDSLLGLVDQVKEALMAARDQEKIFILIVDEAHMLSDVSLEQIRLLSNIETQEGKLLQILLVGQYELSHHLNLPEFRQLRQRINVNRFLSPLSAAETWQYVEHRLQKVGSSFDRCFAPGCKTLIHKLTGGVPRHINHLCDTALLVAMGEGSEQVSGKALAKAQEALQTDQIFTPQTPQFSSPVRKTSSFDKVARISIAVLSGVFLITLGWVLGSSSFLGGSAKAQQLLSQGGIIQAFQKIWPGTPGSSRSPGPRPGASPAGVLTAVPSPAREAGLPPAEPAPPPSGPAAMVSPSPVVSAPASPGKLEKVAPPLTAPPPAAAGKKLTTPVPENPPGSKDSLPVPGDQRAPSPPSLAKEPTPAASSGNQAPCLQQVEVEKDDNLTRIAGRCFPGQVELGMVALLLANPQNLNQNKIVTGQKLTLPVIDPANRTIQLKEGAFYALFGEYPTIHALQKATSRLSQQNLRYTVMSNETSKEVTFYQVLIGAYGTREDLEQALSRLQEKSR